MPEDDAAKPRPPGGHPGPARARDGVADAHDGGAQGWAADAQAPTPQDRASSGSDSAADAQVATPRDRPSSGADSAADAQGPAVQTPAASAEHAAADAQAPTPQDRAPRGRDATAHAQDRLAARFEAHRARLRAAAYRMLGSAGEAEDAVQEAWLRLSRVDAAGIDNLAAWLTTVLSRVCLDALRARGARHEDLFGEPVPERAEDAEQDGDPVREALLADSVGRALLVVLDTLGPAERVAFVLHDTFAVPFEQIAPIVGRSPVAAKKLASRARLKVRGTQVGPAVAEAAAHRKVVDAFLAASRTGDLPGLLAVLAPDVVRRADPSTLPAGVAVLVRGARTVAEETVVLGRRARYAEAVLIDGSVGVVVAPHGRLRLALTLTISADRITSYEVIASPRRLRALTFTLLPA